MAITYRLAFLFSLAGLAFSGAVSPAWSAKDTEIAAEAESDVQQHRAPVIIDGRVVFYVRGVSAYPAEARAEAISKHVKEAAADRSLLPTALRSTDNATVTSILINDHPIMRVFDADATLEGVSRPLLADIYRQKISEAMTDYQRDREPHRLFVNLTQAGLATLFLVILLWGIRGLFRFLDNIALRRVKLAIDQLQDRVSHIIQIGSLWNTVRGMLNVLKWVTVIGTVYAYLAFVLELFPWTRSKGRALFSLFLDPLHRIASGLLDAIPGLVFVAAVILLARYVLKVLRLFFAGIEQGRIEMANFDRDWAWPTYKIVRVLVIAFTAVVAYPYIPGSDSEAFKGISLFIGLVFSLGSSSVISNLIAGYSMTYRRAFKLGDIIRVSDVVGSVTDIGLVVTRLRTPKNEDVIIPNSEILNKNVVNYTTLSKKEGLILHTKIGIGYEVSWRQVEAMLLMAADRTPGLMKSPAPFVHLREMGDFAVVYELNAYCQTPQRMLYHYTGLHKNILDLFNEHGVQIMTPAYEGDPDTPKVVPKEQWYAAPATKG